MGLSSLKWLILMIILVISLGAGFTTLHIASKYRKLVALGEALANGIFIGAAVFHLIPDAARGLYPYHTYSPYLYALLIVLVSFCILFLFEQILSSKAASYRHVTNATSLIITLSLHAFLTGIALGISNSYVVVVSLLIAILAHKAFEMFALVINLHRQLRHTHHVRLLFFLFSFVTPLGILLGSSGNYLLPFAISGLLTAYFNAICAGTFLYIATIHAHHRHHPYSDSYQKYEQTLATLFGVVVMGALALWI